MALYKIRLAFFCCCSVCLSVPFLGTAADNDDEVLELVEPLLLSKSIHVQLAFGICVP